MNASYFVHALHGLLAISITWSTLKATEFECMTVVSGALTDEFGTIISIGEMTVGMAEGANVNAAFGFIECVSDEINPSIPGDLDGNDAVNVLDLFALLSAWGACPEPCPPADSCPADITNPAGTGPDCSVDVFDLFLLLANWSN